MIRLPVMSLRRRLPTLSLAVGLAILGVGQGLALVDAGRSEPPVRLRLAYEQDEVLRYDTEVSADGAVSSGVLTEDLEMQMRFVMKLTVLDVDEDGVATLAAGIESGSATINGRTVPIEQVAAGVEGRTMRIAPDGAVLTGPGGLTTSVTGPASFPGVGTLAPLLPHHPVAPGDHWDSGATITIGEEGPALTVRAESRFEGYGSVRGRRAAVIAVTSEAPMNFTANLGELAAATGQSVDLGPQADLSVTYSGSATSEGRNWVDVERGIQLRSEVTAHVDFEFRLEGSTTTPASEPPTDFEVDFGFAMELR